MRYCLSKVEYDTLPENIKSIINENNDIKVLLRLEEISDEIMYRHSLNVAYLVDKMMTAYETELDKIGLFAPVRTEIIKGALLHDIGKVFIPLGLMISSKKFSNEEKNIANLHTTLGNVILDGLFSRTVCDITMYHHNPYLLLSEEEAKTAMIYMIYTADIFDALVSDRSYKQAYSIESALECMEKEEIPEIYIGILKNVLSKEGE